MRSPIGYRFSMELALPTWSLNGERDTPILKCIPLGTGCQALQYHPNGEGRANDLRCLNLALYDCRSEPNGIEISW